MTAAAAAVICLFHLATSILLSFQYLPVLFDGPITEPTGVCLSLCLFLSLSFHLSSFQSPLPLVNAHADEIVDFLLHILGDDDTEMNLKDSSALVRLLYDRWPQTQTAGGGGGVEVDTPLYIRGCRCILRCACLLPVCRFIYFCLLFPNIFAPGLPPRTCSEKLLVGWNCRLCCVLACVVCFLVAQVATCSILFHTRTPAQAHLIFEPVRLTHSSTLFWNICLSSPPPTHTQHARTQVLTQLAEAKPKLVAKTGKVPQILQVLMNLIAGYKGSAANALFNYQALDDDEDDEDYDG